MCLVVVGGDINEVRCGIESGWWDILKQVVCEFATILAKLGMR